MFGILFIFGTAIHIFVKYFILLCVAKAHVIYRGLKECGWRVQLSLLWFFFFKKKWTQSMDFAKWVETLTKSEDPWDKSHVGHFQASKRHWLLCYMMKKKHLTSSLTRFDTFMVCLDKIYLTEIENWKYCNKIIFK